MDYRNIFVNNLQRQTKENKIKFHMPSHNIEKFKYDLTEYETMESLFARTEGIKEIENFYSYIYGAKNSYLGTCGTTNFIGLVLYGHRKKHSTIVIPRNCHQSILKWARVFNYEIRLIGEMDHKILKSHKMSLSEEHYLKFLKKLQKAELKEMLFVFYTPTYYGEIEEYDEVLKIIEEGNGSTFLDCAHGGHLVLDKKYKEMYEKYNYVAVSLHKTMGVLSQGSLLLENNVQDSIREEIEECFKIFQSTSPNYEIIYSMGKSQEKINKEEVSLNEEEIKSLIKEINASKFMVINKSKLVINEDPLKVFFTSEALNLRLLTEFLRKKGINFEMSEENFLLLYGSPFKDFVGDLKKLQIILNSLLKSEREQVKLKINQLGNNQKNPDVNSSNLSIYKKKDFKINEKGEYEALRDIILYPPGIIVLLKGEKIKDIGPS